MQADMTVPGTMPEITAIRNASPSLICTISSAREAPSCRGVNDGVEPLVLKGFESSDHANERALVIILVVRGDGLLGRADRVLSRRAADWLRRGFDFCAV